MASLSFQEIEDEKDLELHSKEDLRSGLIWKAGVPRSGWIYDGEYLDNGSVIAECEMCTHPIRYEHFIHHPDHESMSVGCVCAEKLSRENALENRTGMKITDSDMYTVLTNAKWKKNKKGNMQLKLNQNTRLYKYIVNIFNCKGSPVFLYPSGFVFIPNFQDEIDAKKQDPVFSIVKKKISETYKKRFEKPKNNVSISLTEDPLSEEMKYFDLKISPLLENIYDRIILLDDEDATNELFHLFHQKINDLFLKNIESAKRLRTE